MILGGADPYSEHDVAAAALVFGAVGGAVSFAQGGAGIVADR